MTNVIFYLAIAACLIFLVISVHYTFKKVNSIEECFYGWYQLKIQKFCIFCIFPSIYLIWKTLDFYKRCNFDSFDDKFGFVLILMLACIYTFLFFIGLRAFRVLINFKKERDSMNAK